jgi:REP element-mobilizing transposase RayT
MLCSPSNTLSNPERKGVRPDIYRREAIFCDKADRRRFIETLGEACGKTDWQVHAYCLMNNHFHLMVETPNANL